MLIVRVEPSGKSNSILSPEMPLILRNFTLFSYRAFSSRPTFTTKNGFLFSLDRGKLFQTKTDTNSSLHHPLPVEPTGILAHRNFLLISSTDSLYLFDSSCSRLSSREPLSREFISSSGFVYSVSPSHLSAIDPSKKQPFREWNLPENCGICICIEELNDGATVSGIVGDSNDRTGISGTDPLLFGFENGSFLALVENKLFLYKKLELSLIFSALSDNALYSITDDARLVKTSLISDDSKFTACADLSPKLLFYRKIVLYFYRKVILYFSRDLVLLEHSRTQFEIADICIDEDCLYIGYESGLIVSYDLPGLYASLSVCL